MIRTRNFPDYFLSVDMPVKETVYYKKEERRYKISIRGEVDLERLDKPKFVQACKMMFGRELNFADISFSTHEHHELDHKLNFEEGKYTHNFEVKGIHFKRDTLQYWIRKDS